jgi:hypothetical protein
MDVEDFIPDEQLVSWLALAKGYTLKKYAGASRASAPRYYLIKVGKSEIDAMFKTLEEIRAYLEHLPYVV